jgi:predicted  nucleic acid-binding Zn-ribbon protein
MATAKNKAAESDYSMEEKIKALYELQHLDSKIDEINKVKGELPLEVGDLEDEIAGLRTRTDNISAEIEELTQLTRQRKRESEEAGALIVKYEEQQRNVRNNREFDALAKEIEYQRLEIDLASKRLKEYSAAMKTKKAQIEQAEAVVADRTLDLEQKRVELEGIEAETAAQIAALDVQVAEAAAHIDDRMLTAYRRIRGNMHNGLAVVTVKRDACGGCFNRIPPQRQVDVRQNKKIIVCEYCGRILVAEPSTPEAEA